MGERVAIAAPPGLCIDPASVDVGRGGGQALIVECRLVGMPEAGDRRLDGVMRIGITTGDLPGDLAALEAFLTDEGLSVLGRSGDPEAVRLLARRLTDEALYLKVEDTGPPPFPDAAPVFWRAFFPAGGRLIGASVTGFGAGAVPDDEAVRLLQELVAAVRGVNG